jgi:hypothetical protein
VDRGIKRQLRNFPWIRRCPPSLGVGGDEAVAAGAIDDRYLNQSIIQFKSFGMNRYFRWLREVKGDEAAQEALRKFNNEIA